MKLFILSVVKCNDNIKVAVSRFISTISLCRLRHSCNRQRTTGKQGLESTSRSVPLCLVKGIIGYTMKRQPQPFTDLSLINFQ